MYYIVDSNIWIDVAQGNLACNDVIGKTGVRVVLAPLMIIELVRGILKGGKSHFQENRLMIKCMATCDILELPRVFMFQILWNVPGGVSGVRPQQYRTLLDLVIASQSLADFVIKTEAPGSVWKRMVGLDSIHEDVLDKELSALGTIADRGSVQTLNVNMARMYKLNAMLPDPDTSK